MRTSVFTCLLAAAWTLVVPVVLSQTVTDMFRVVPLASGLSDPMQIAVAADGRVFIAERTGALKHYDPVARATTVSGTLAVSAPSEDGLIGLALDPAFAANRRLFLFFSPKDKPSELHLSRFTLTVDYKLDPSSRQDLLRIPFRQNEHSSGGLAFDSQGNLYIGTGDDSNNLPDGFPPMDETPGRSDYDAQKSSANTDDLRGKILRIRPTENGYSIPAGNLFAAGQAKTRREIYAMGNRNPFRLTIDPKTDWLYWAEPGPNARADDPTRGLRGVDEVNLAKAPGNYGWPYCVGPQRCFRDYDYAAKTSGPAFAPASLRNDSPNNTGNPDLPPAQGAFLWYSYTNPDGFPVFGSGSAQAAMTGPLYRYDPTLASATKLPRDFDNCLFLLDWGRSFLHYAKLSSTGALLSVHRFREGPSIRAPIDLKLGPEGALYLLNWGSNSYPHTSEGSLSRIEYTGPQEPVSTFRDAQSSTQGTRFALPGTRVNVPTGMTRLDAFNLRGQKAWTYKQAAPSQRDIQIPENLTGVLHLRFSK